jgi:hypothetical protein
MAARTHAAVAVLTNFPPFTTRETVMVPTPDSRATSAMVGLPDGFLDMNSFIDYEMRPLLATIDRRRDRYHRFEPRIIPPISPRGPENDTGNGS